MARATDQQIADLQSTLMAVVIALDNLPELGLNTEYFQIARDAAFEIAWQAMPGGNLEDDEHLATGMRAGWLAMGEVATKHGISEIILTRLLEKPAHEYSKRRPRLER